jgi:methylated-DNA-[protein]-cysteine S-methyltransferase
VRVAVVESPIGPLTLTGDGEALSGLYMDVPQRPPPVAPDAIRDDSAFTAARSQLAAYFAGELRVFDLELALRGTPFQLAVWEALQAIPYGETVSYGELARRLGRPAASRAVGLANGRNPVSIVVPCHRVIGSGGALTGYGGGLERKRRLLELEAGRLTLH